MKKAIKSIAKSLRTLEACQVKSTSINEEFLAYSRDINRVLFKRFESELTPVVSIMESLLKLVPTNLKPQEMMLVNEARKMVGLMKYKQ